MLMKNKVEGITKLEKKGRNRVSIEFTNMKLANSFLDSSFAVNNKFRQFIPRHLISCKGIIREVDPNLSEGTILENIKTDSGRNVIQVKRIKRKKIDDFQNTSYVNTASIVVTFKGKSLPKFVSLFYNVRVPELYISPVIQCFNCARYGHTKTQCKSLPRCPACSKDHLLECCPVKNSPSCLFCKGNHYSTELNTRLSERVCPEFTKQKKIKSLMASYNFSFYEASKICSDHSTRNKPSLQLNDDGNFPSLARSSINLTSISEPSVSVVDSIKKRSFNFSKAVTPNKRPISPSLNFYSNNLLMNPNGRLSESSSKRYCGESDLSQKEGFSKRPHQDVSSEQNFIISSLKTTFEKDPTAILLLFKAIFPKNLHNHFSWLETVSTEEVLVH